MPDSKITALTSISTSTDPANDPLVIVDVSDTSMAATGTTKKVTLNQLLGASGTATLASATITGDLTVDTSTLKVDSANNRVGIGTASPAVPLEIYKASGDSKMRITSGANSLTIGWDDPNGFYYTANTSLMAWQLSGSTAMTLNSNGLGVGGVPSGLAPVILCEGIAGTYAKFSSKVGAKTWSAGYRSGTLQYEIQEDGVERYTIGNGGTPHTWYIGASTAMTLNSTGLGVGVSPTEKLTINNSSGAVTGGIRVYANDQSIARIAVQNTNGQAWHLVAGNPGASNQGFGIYDYTNSATRMYFDTSGNVGIGVTPKPWRSGARALQLGANGYLTLNEQANGNANICFAAYEGSANVFNYTTTGDLPSRYVLVSGTHQWYTAPSGTAGNAITFTEVMRLDASGNLLVGTTGLNGSWNTKLTLSNDSGTTKWAVGPYLGGVTNFLISAGASAGVYLNGTAATSWTSASDERLKDIIEPISNAIAKVGSLRAVIGKFKFDENNTRKPFLIAQDIQAVLPEAVDASNPDKLGVAYTDVIPLLVAAIKELTAEVNALKNA